MITRPALKLVNFAFLVWLAVSCELAFGQDQLDNATVITTALNANDIVYDQRRNLIYASVGPSEAIPFGNAIAILDPQTLEVSDIKFLRRDNEPGKLAITADSSRVYIGLDGSSALQYYEPGSIGAVGPLQPLNGRIQLFTRPDLAIAEDIIVSPTDPKTVLVSSDTIGNTANGNIEIFNDSGKIGGSNENFGPNSFTFVDSETIFGYENDSTGFRNIRYSFDGNAIAVDQFKYTFDSDQIIQGFFITIEAAGGLIYSSDGQVLDPFTLTLKGKFPEASGQVEANAADELAYFLDGSTLKVYDINSFLLLDEAALPLPAERDTETLIYVGEDRLAFINEDGDIGLISGIPFSPLPQARLDIEGTSGDDWVTFDPVAREISVNGEITPVQFETTTIHFFGEGGTDHVTSLGDPTEEEIAVLERTEMTVKGESYFFAVHDVAELEFESQSQSDTCIIFDSHAREQLSSTPTSVQLERSGSLLKATTVGTTYVFSSGGNDSAKMRGSVDSERVVANMENRLIRMTGNDFFVSLSGFEIVNANGGSGKNDSARIVDSNVLDLVFFRDDFGRFLNDTTDYSIRSF